jgi:hypothetical protein
LFDFEDFEAPAVFCCGFADGLSGDGADGCEAGVVGHAEGGTEEGGVVRDGEVGVAVARAPGERRGGQGLGSDGLHYLGYRGLR